MAGLEISASEGQLKVEMVWDMFNNLCPGRRKRETVLMSPGVLLNIDPQEFRMGSSHTAVFFWFFFVFVFFKFCFPFTALVLKVFNLYKF